VRAWLLPALAIFLALLVGAVLAFQLYLTASVYQESKDLRREVAVLSGRVCYYQALASGLNRRLAKQGFHKVKLPPQVPCPPSVP
jgi:hypothetical protein